MEELRAFRQSAIDDMPMRCRQSAQTGARALESLGPVPPRLVERTVVAQEMCSGATGRGLLDAHARVQAREPPSCLAPGLDSLAFRQTDAGSPLEQEVADAGRVDERPEVAGAADIDTRENRFVRRSLAPVVPEECRFRTVCFGRFRLPFRGLGHEFDRGAVVEANVDLVDEEARG